MGEIHRPPEGFVALTMAKPLRLGGVPEHFSLPIQLSMKKGLVGSEEVTFDAQPGGTGQMIENLNNGSLDVAFALTEGMVMATTSGVLKGCSIVGVYVESPLEWGVHLHPEKQNRVAISRFMSGSHLMSYAFTKQNDWPAEKLQFVPTGGLRGALEAFKDDKVDLFLWDQFMTTPCVEDGTLKKVGVVPSPWPCFVVVARDEVRGPALDRLVRIFLEEAHEMKAHPEESVPTLMREFNLSESIARQWLESTRFAEPGTELSDRVRETILKYIPQ